MEDRRYYVYSDVDGARTLQGGLEASHSTHDEE